MMRIPALCISFVAAALLTGCPPSAEDCQPGTFWDANTEMCVAQNNPQQCPPGQTWNGTACMAQQQCPAGTVFNGSGCVAQQPQPQSGGACNAQAVPGDVALPVLTGAGQGKIPPGARPIGSMMAGNFQAGQCLEQTIQAQMGKCYTVIGVGMGMPDVDLELIPAIAVPGAPAMPPVATDQDNGTAPVIGAHPNCFTAMVPGPLRVVIRVEGGQGLAAAQVYER